MLSIAQIAELIEQINAQRSQLGFLTISELVALSARGNVILDPFSTFVGAKVQLGAGNVLYPGVVLETRNGGTLEIGEHNRFDLGSTVLADAGQVRLGSHNEFGGAGIKVSHPDALLTVGDHGRYLDGAQLIGPNRLGDGAQVLGAITVQNCYLESGMSYRHADPDLRAGVLKGAGIARDLLVRQGEVINRRVMFDQASIERQVTYHPK